MSDGEKRTLDYLTALAHARLDQDRTEMCEWIRADFAEADRVRRALQNDPLHDVPYERLEAIRKFASIGMRVCLDELARQER